MIRGKLNPKKILIRSVNWIGDTVMSMPAVYQLRRAFPGAEIHILVQNKLADLWINNPAINGIITFSKSDSLFAVAKKIKHHEFDLGIVFPNSIRSALELWLAGIPHRIGFKFGLRSLFLSIGVKPPHGFVKIKKINERKIKKIVSTGAKESVIKFSPQFHHIFNYLRIVEITGATQEPVEPHIFISRTETDLFIQKFNLQKLFDRKILGLNPGAEYGVAKRWYPERFAEAAVQLNNSTGCNILIFGGKKDEPLCDYICSRIKSCINKSDFFIVNLAGKTSLRELCAGLKICNVVITNDTGPAHIAAAVGTRVVSIFASTSPELTAPGLPDSKKHIIIRSYAPCSPCFRRQCPIDFRCIQEIKVQQVVEAALSILRT